MSQRQERHAVRPDDVEEDLPELDVDIGVDGVDNGVDIGVDNGEDVGVDIAPFDSQRGEPADPADPVAATPALTGGDPLKSFSDDARKRYEMEVSSFAADLRRQSLEHKRSHGGDNVSGRNVISAVRFLRSHRSDGILRHLGAVGGVLIGLGAQALAGMVGDGVYTTGGVLWGAGTAVLGAGLLVWHLART